MSPEPGWTRRSAIQLGLACAIGAVPAAATSLVDRPSSAAGSRLPRSVLGVYWTHWNDEVPLRDVPAAYNVLYVFAADLRSGDGTAHWNYPEIGPDVRLCRARGQRVLLSIGGEGQGATLADPADAERLVTSVVRIDATLGGRPGAPMLSGVDLNTYEGEVVPDLDGYLWVCRELRRRLGESFAITTPPAALSAPDQAFCRDLLAAGAVDYVAPQFYGDARASDPEVIVARTNEWVRWVADGDASRIVVGFGVEDLPDFSTAEQVRSAWTRIRREHPRIRGAYLWQHGSDAARGWPFAHWLAQGLRGS